MHDAHGLPKRHAPLAPTRASRVPCVQRNSATRARTGKYGGGEEIRTPGTRKGTAVFKTAALDHSATPPRRSFWLKCTSVKVPRRWSGWRKDSVPAANGFGLATRIPIWRLTASPHVEVKDRARPISASEVREFAAKPWAQTPHRELVSTSGFDRGARDEGKRRRVKLTTRGRDKR